MTTYSVCRNSYSTLELLAHSLRISFAPAYRTSINYQDTEASSASLYSRVASTSSLHMVASCAASPSVPMTCAVAALVWDWPDEFSFRRVDDLKLLVSIEALCPADRWMCNVRHAGFSQARMTARFLRFMHARIR